MGMEEILAGLKQSVSRDYICSAIIGLDGMYLAFDAIKADQEGTKLAAYLADGLREVMDMIQQMESGRLHYLLIATDKFKIFILPIGKERKYFCALTIQQDGNVGKALLELEKAEPLLKKELGL